MIFCNSPAEERYGVQKSVAKNWNPKSKILSEVIAQNQEVKWRNPLAVEKGRYALETSNQKARYSLETSNSTRTEWPGTVARSSEWYWALTGCHRPQKLKRLPSTPGNETLQMSTSAQTQMKWGLIWTPDGGYHGLLEMDQSSSTNSFLMEVKV